MAVVLAAWELGIRGEDDFSHIFILIAGVFLAERVLAILEGVQSDGESLRVEKDFRDLPAKLLGTHDIVFFPTRDEGAKYVIHMSEMADSIRNTVLRFGYCRPVTPEVDDTYQAWLDTKERVLKVRHKPIREIVSAHLLSTDPTRTHLEQHIALRNCNFVLIDDDAKLPLIQMTIFDYGRFSEVVFGWESPGGPQGPCFASRNPALVSYFIRYFEALYKYAEDHPTSWLSPYPATEAYEGPA